MFSNKFEYRSVNRSFLDMFTNLFIDLLRKQLIESFITVTSLSVVFISLFVTFVNLVINISLSKS
jgi:hypothetical protein